MNEALSEVLSSEECLQFLPLSQVGRLGVSIRGLPSILPINYIVVGESIFIRVSGESEVFRAVVGAVIAFEVDGYDAGGSYGWSVLVRGIAEEVTDPDELVLARSLWLTAWPLGERADRFLVIPTTILSGRRFVRDP